MYAHLPSKSFQAVMDEDTYQITDPMYIEKILNVCRRSFQSNTMIVFETDSRTGNYEEFSNEHTLFISMN